MQLVFISKNALTLSSSDMSCFNCSTLIKAARDARAEFVSQRQSKVESTHTAQRKRQRPSHPAFENSPTWYFDWPPRGEKLFQVV